MSSTASSSSIIAAIERGYTPAGARQWLVGIVHAAGGRADAAAARRDERSAKIHAVVRRVVEELMLDRPGLTQHEAVQHARNRARCVAPFAGAHGPSLAVVRAVVAEYFEEKRRLTTETIAKMGNHCPTFTSTAGST